MVDYPLLLLKRYGIHNKGTVAGFHPARAAFLIQQGIAKPCGRSYADRAAICKDLGVAVTLAGEPTAKTTAAPSPRKRRRRKKVVTK